MKKIIIFEKSKDRMHLMGDILMELLDTKIEQIQRTGEFTQITTNTHEIRILSFSEDRNFFESPYRGLKADYVINNTHNNTIAINSIMVSSSYMLRMFCPC